MNAAAKYAEVQSATPREVRYAMAATMLSRIDNAIEQTTGEIERHSLRLKALMEEREKVMLALNPFKAAA